MSTYLRVQTVDLNPEMVSRITAAYEQALHTLCVKDRDDPLTEIVEARSSSSRKRRSSPRRNCGCGDQGTRMR